MKPKDKADKKFLAKKIKKMFFWDAKKYYGHIFNDQDIIELITNKDFTNIKD